MANSLWIGQVRATVGDGFTVFTIPRHGAHNWNTPESVRQITTRFAGTFSRLNAHVTTNGTTSASTFSFRKNTAAGSETVSISSGATGNFQDTSNTDSIAAADILGYQIVSGGGGTMTIKTRSNVFIDSTQGQCDIIYGTAFNSSFSIDSTTVFLSFGIGGAGTTEANDQNKIQSAGILKNLYSNVTANTRVTTSTLGTRINSVTKALVVSFAGGVTGIVEDTSNNDTVAENDLVNLYCTLGTSGGTLSERALSCGFQTITNKYVLSAIGGATLPVTATTLYFNFGDTQSSATESDFSSSANLDNRGSLLWVYLSANTTIAASTIRFRLNRANANQLVSPGAGATGQFQDSSNTDNVLSTHLMNLVATDGTGTITINGVTMQFENVSVSRQSQFFQLFP